MGSTRAGSNPADCEAFSLTFQVISKHGIYHPSLWNINKFIILSLKFNFRLLLNGRMYLIENSYILIEVCQTSNPSFTQRRVAIKLGNLVDWFYVYSMFILGARKSKASILYEKRKVLHWPS